MVSGAGLAQALSALITEMSALEAMRAS